MSKSLENPKIKGESSSLVTKLKALNVVKEHHFRLPVKQSPRKPAKPRTNKLRH